MNIVEQISTLPNKTFFDLNYKSQKIKDLSLEDNFKVGLGILLTKICALSGIKSQIDDFSKKDISNMICTQFKNLTTADIWKAFELERYLVYGSKTEHFNLFDASYISSVLKKYIEWCREEKVKLNYTPQVEENLALPSETESHKKEMMTKAIIKSFEHYLITGKLPDEPQTHIFDELYERGFIKNPKDYPDYFAKQNLIAYTQLAEEYKIQANENLSFRSVLKNKLSELEKGDKGALVARIKRNVLIDLFEKYKSDKTFIENLKNYHEKT